MKKIFTFIAIFFMMCTYTYAACDQTKSAEMYQKAANVKANYEIVKETMKLERGEYSFPYIKISIINADEDLYFVVKNSVDKKEETYKYKSAKDGIITLYWYDIDVIANYTITIYSSDKTGCKDEKLRTLYLNTPRYNEFSEREVCEELDDFYLCQEFVSFDKITQDKFTTQLENFRSGKIDEKGEEVKNVTFFDKVFSFLDKYKWFVIGGTVLIVGAVVVVYKKGKKSRELGL